ncbi:MAG: thioredoxin domain-containing protein [Deltaproteobacteria bacterium]|nr:thioredoxin domain-containing protein [Deltaproteobacteria bacterium]
MRTATLLPLILSALLAGCSRPSGAAQDPATPVARVDGRVITDGELTAEAKPALVAADNKHAEEVHSVRARALESLVEKRLFEARAAKEGITVDALLQREVTGRIPEPDEATLQNIYDQTKASGRPLPPFDAVKAEIAQFVKGQSADGVRQAFVARLKADAKVETLLPPLLLPKVEVKADGPSRGDAGAPITIVEFSDYQCEFCARAEPAVKRALAEYKGKVRVVLQSYPLSIHPFAVKASEAALCAGEQGRYWEMHDRLFASQQALQPADLKNYAKALGLDAGKFDGCLDSGRMTAAVQASQKLGESVGVSGTPAFFINGRPLSGSQPFERFKELIDWELGAAKR